jgi:hypothetical protein
MICGVLDVQVIDGKYGSPKIGVPEYQAICIGEEDEDSQVVRFEAEFNAGDPFYKARIEGGDSVAGRFKLTYQMSDKISFRKPILTFIAPDLTYVKEQLAQGRDLVGKACLSYTRGFTADTKLVDIHYTFRYRRHEALIHRIAFNISVQSLRESAKIIHSLEADRIMHI